MKHSTIRILSPLILVTIFFVFWLLPNDHQGHSLNLDKMLVPPSLEFPLGTDNLGRDLLGQVRSVFYDAIFPLWITIALSFLLAVPCIISFLTISLDGSLNQYISKGLQGVFGLGRAVPATLFVFFATVLIGEAGITAVAAPMFILFFLQTCNLISLLALRDFRKDYWSAHKSMGGSSWQRLWTYGIKSNWSKDLIELLLVQLKIGLCIEASLSFLGVGIQEPDTSFGNILASHFDLILKGDFFLFFVMFLALFISMEFPRSLYTILKYAYNRLKSEPSNPSNVYHLGTTDFLTKSR